jgi:8-oxo-dGTP pyrophosphatase MutT (NUDIX family)
VPRDAATVVVLRESPAGLEVLLLQRAERGDHNSGAWVFPGGLLEGSDRAHGEHAFQRAAVRECFEECGILLAQDAAGGWPQIDDAQHAELAALRPQVAAGSLPIEAVCERVGAQPALAHVHFIAHWLTPLGRAKRFDTRFFLAVVPASAQALHDAHETTDHIWMPVADALAPGHARRLMTPTRAVLQSLLPFTDTAALQAWAAGLREVPCIVPRLALGPTGERPVMPDEPAFDEIGKLDPEGRCTAWHTLQPGVEVRLGAHLTRTTGEDGVNHYAVDGQAVPPTMPLLVAEDRIAIEGPDGQVPAMLLAGADWLAPRRGFLRRLVPGGTGTQEASPAG